MKKQVLLAMSGGVDSSVAAYLLKKKGYSVIGVTFRLLPKEVCTSYGQKNRCLYDAINDARLVCDKLNIPHLVIGCEKLFREEVIDYFIKSYESGCTPNPCIACNERIKFPLLLEKAKETDSQFIATGHYARCVFDKSKKRYLIREAKDKGKDQSYVLFSLPQEVLSHLILPVGEFTKLKIKAIAKCLNLWQAERPESQEICFVLNNNLERFLKEHLGKRIRPGNIRDINGRLLGKHPGICFFTRGQRKGLHIPFGKPLYVVDIRYDTEEVIVGEYKDTLKESVIANNINWVDKVYTKTKRPVDIEVKLRYRHPKSKATITTLSKKKCLIRFLKPQASPTPGQAAVFYKGDTVIGGGWIV